MGVSGKIIEDPKWHPYSPQNGELLDVAFSYSDLIWPWSGFLAVHMTVTKEGANFEGTDTIFPMSFALIICQRTFLIK